MPSSIVGHSVGRLDLGELGRLGQPRRRRRESQGSVLDSRANTRRDLHVLGRDVADGDEPHRIASRTRRRSSWSAALQDCAAACRPSIASAASTATSCSRPTSACDMASARASSYADDHARSTRRGDRPACSGRRRPDAARRRTRRVRQAAASNRQRTPQRIAEDSRRLAALGRRSVRLSARRRGHVRGTVSDTPKMSRPTPTRRRSEQRPRTAPRISTRRLDVDHDWGGTVGVHHHDADGLVGQREDSTCACSTRGRLKPPVEVPGRRRGKSCDPLDVATSRLADATSTSSICVRETRTIRSATSTSRPTPMKTGPFCDETSSRSVGPAKSISAWLGHDRRTRALQVPVPDSTALSGPITTAAPRAPAPSASADDDQQPAPEPAHHGRLEPCSRTTR